MNSKNSETCVCCSCKKELSLDNFHKHSKRANGHQTQCKACNRESNKRWEAKVKQNPLLYENAKKKDREAKRGKKQTRTAVSPERSKYQWQRWITRFPEKYAAENACHKLPKVKGINFHHWSYRKEHRRDVIPLTKPQHYLVHRFMVYDQERMMYRRMDGTLIDSREAAIAYYATLKD